MQVTETEHSIKDLFSNNVTSRLSNNYYNLETAQVGRDKFILDNVDISLPIVAVVSSFGPYLKYIVSGIPNCCIALSDTETAEPDRSGYCPLSTLLHTVTEKNKTNYIMIYFIFLSPFLSLLKNQNRKKGKSYSLCCRTLSGISMGTNTFLKKEHWQYHHFFVVLLTTICLNSQNIGSA